MLDADDWRKRVDEDNAHITVTEVGRHIARTIRRLLPNQRTDVSLLKLVIGLTRDGQGFGSSWYTPESDKGTANDG